MEQTIIGTKEASLVPRVNTARRVAPDYRAEVDGIDKAEWLSLLPKFEDAMIYQTWSYGEIRWSRRNLSHLVLKTNGKIVSIAQARIVKPPFLKCGIAYVAWGPVWRLRGQEPDLEIFRQMVVALKREYIGLRGLYLRILPNEIDGDPNPDAGAIHDIFADEGFTRKPTSSRTLLLDITPSQDEIRRNLTVGWRNRLSAAEKKGLKLIEGTGDDLYAAFSVLYHQILDRKGFVPGVDIDEFRQIQKDLPEPLKMKIIVCESEGEPVAALICSLVGNTGIYVLGATGNNGMKLQGSYLLHYRMIEWLKQRHARWYDLGGINPEKNPGTYHFKAGLAGKDGKEVYLLGQFDNCQSLMSAFLVRAGDQFRVNVEKLKHAIRRPSYKSTTKTKDNSGSL